MFKCLTLLCLLFTYTLTFSQSKIIDSLKVFVQACKEDTQKVNVLNDLCIEMNQNGDYFLSLEIGKKSLLLSQKLLFKKGEANAHRLLGKIQKKLGNHPESLKHNFSSLKLNEGMGDKKGIAGAYNNIGTIYLEQGNYKEALNYVQKALKIFQEIDDKNWIHNSYTNIGNIYSDQGKYELAMENYLTALQIRVQLKDVKGVAAIYNNIGLVNHLQHDYQAAVKNFNTSIKIAEEAKHQNGIANAYFNMGMSYIAMKKFEGVKAMINKSLAICITMKNIDGIKECYQGLSSLDSAQGNFKDAFQHHKLFIEFRDSLINEEKIKKIIQAQMQYNFDKKELQTKMAQEQKDTQTKRNRNVLLGGVGLLVILFILFFRNYQSRQAIQQKLVLEQTKNAISRDLHDDIGSTLNNISLFAEVARKRVEKNESIQDLVSNISNISKDMMAKMGDIVWSLKAGNESVEKLNERLLNYCSQSLTPLHIDYSFDINPELNQYALNSEMLKEIYLIAKEAINNSMKYAACTNINIYINKQQQHLIMKIKDDGKGFDITKPIEGMGGAGLNNMKARAKNIGAEIEIKSSEISGTEISLLIPFIK